MDLSKKLPYFHNDLYSFIEDIWSLDIINSKVARLVLSKLSRTYHDNFGNDEVLEKDYKIIDDFSFEGIQLIKNKFKDSNRLTTRKSIDDFATALNEIHKITIENSIMTLKFDKRPYVVDLDKIYNTGDLLNMSYELLGKHWMNASRVKLAIGLIAERKGFNLEVDIF